MVDMNSGQQGLEFWADVAEINPSGTLTGHLHLSAPALKRNLLQVLESMQFQDLEGWGVKLTIVEITCNYPQTS